jgi:prenyltransferase beta subunit
VVALKKLRQFVLSLQDKKGGVATSRDEKADPNNGWLMKHLLELEMEDVMRKFQRYLLRCQNADGGWGANGGNISMISATANALRGLCDVGVSAHDSAVEDAVKFLFSYQRKGGGFSETVDVGVPWMKPGVEWGWITAVVVEALHGAGVRITTPAFDDAALFVRKCFWEFREGIEGQATMVRALRNAGFKVFIETKEMKRRIDALLPADNGGFPKVNPNLDTTLNILTFLYDIGVREDDARFCGAVDFVASSRNDDGGWPAAPGEKSVLWASLESALLLKNLEKLS